MAIRSGQILHTGRGVVIDRIQTAGPGNLNLNEEQIRELGNFETVAVTRDVPDLSFDLESWDMSTEIEALLLNLADGSLGAGYEFDFDDAIPIDITSPWKRTNTDFDTLAGIALPHLALENITYRAGVRQNSNMTATLRGDSIYYVPGTPYFEVFNASGTGPYNFSNGPGIVTRESGDEVYAYGVTLVTADGDARRLFVGIDFTNTATGFTLLEAAPAGSQLHVVYGGPAGEVYPQTVHPEADDKPAAVRGADVDVYISAGGATPALVRTRGVQSVEVSRRVNLEPDEEMGNPHAVDRDYDQSDVNGNINVRPRDIQALSDLILQVTDTPAGETANVLSSQPLEMEVGFNYPESHPLRGQRMKTLYVPDARFQPPPFQPRVGQKYETGLPFTSDGGKLYVYKGERP